MEISEFEDALTERDSTRAIGLLDLYCEEILTGMGPFALMLAVEEKLPAVIDRLLELDVNPNEQAVLDLPLSSAIVGYEEDTSLQIIESLIRHGADPNSLDGHGRSALHVAAERGPLDVVQYLIEHGAEADGRSGRGETPLYVAVRNGRVDVCRYLLSLGVDGTARDADGYTVMSRSVFFRHHQIVGMLLGKGIPMDVYSAVHLRQIGVVRGFLKDRPEEIRADPLWNDLLTVAVDVESPELIQLLLCFGADPNAVGPCCQSPLEAACFGNIESTDIVQIVEILLQGGADPGFSSRNPVGWSREQRPRLYDLFQRHGYV